MDKTAAGLLGAVAGVATVSSGHALTTPAASLSEALQVSSYADLLKPIPNALELLRARDAARARQPDESSEGIQTVQGYYYGYGNPYYPPYPLYANPYGYYPRYYHHHHHHHHHYYYHHHHHHHSFYDRRW